MNFTDKFILKISTQVSLLFDLVKNNHLEISQFEKLNSLLDEDFTLRRGLLRSGPGRMPKESHKDKSVNLVTAVEPFTTLIGELTGTTFADQIGIANRFNALIEACDLDADIKASLLFELYLDNNIGFFHLISPVNLHKQNTILFQRINKDVDLVSYQYEDALNKPEFFGRHLAFDAGPLNAVFHVIQFEKSPTELMRFLEFIFSVENLEQLASQLTLKQALDIRTSFSDTMMEAENYQMYQNVVGMKLINEIIYILEEIEHNRRMEKV